MKNGIIFAGIVFAIALAVVIGNRLSNEALAVVVGAVCGISASIPVSIGLVIASANHWGRPAQEDAPSPNAQPPVVIVNSPQPQMPYGFQPNPYYFPAAMPGGTIESREFKIVGGE
jgi:hypothetical protein